MEFELLRQRALEVRRQYAAWERMKYGRPWTREEVALGLVGDVGDLMKLVQAEEGVRDIAEAHSRLAHELADCLWSVLVLANLYGIELEQAFLRMMDELEAQLSSRVVG